MEHPTYFTNVELYLTVLDLFSCYHFRLSARRFLLELFEIDMDFEQLRVLDEYRCKDSSKCDLVPVDDTTVNHDSDSDGEKAPLIGKPQLPKDVLQPVVCIKGFLA
jgi:hypothetical protein